MTNLYNVIFLIIINLIVVLSAFYLSKIFILRKDSADFIITWFLFYLSLIIGLELFLGIFKKLNIFNIVFLHTIIFLILFFISYRKIHIYFKIPDLAFIFNNKILLFSLSIFLGFFLTKFWLNLINPPLGADSLIYHLAFPVTWLKNGNLKNPMLIFGPGLSQAPTNSAPYFPTNAELFFFWLLFPLRNAFLADVAEAPFYFMGILVFYSILRKFDINKSTSLFVALLWMLIPNCLKQIEQGSYVDVICAILFLMSFNFILICDREFNMKNAFILGLCLGLFTGVKSLNISWSLGLIPFFIYVLFKHKRQIKIYNIFLDLSLVVIGILILGGYSYIRNYILTRNIFYPIRLTIFGKVLMPGYIDRLSYANLTYPFKEFSLMKLFFSEGLGLQFLGFILPATFIPLSSLPFIKRFREKFWQYLFIFFIPTFMFTMCLFHIKAYWSRYLYPYLGVGLIVSAIFLDNFKWGKIYITILGFISVISSLAEFAGHIELLASIILSIVIFFIFIWLKKNIIINKKIKMAIIISLVILLTVMLGFLNNKYYNEEYNRYIKIYEDREVAYAWKWLDDNTGSGKRIAYTGRAEFYPLFGKGFKNDVFYISINDKPSIPHYYPDGLYRKEKNFFAWRNNLIKEKIDYLFVYLPYENTEFPVEDQWAKEHAMQFRLVFQNNKTKIYWLVR